MTSSRSRGCRNVRIGRASVLLVAVLIAFSASLQMVAAQVGQPRNLLPPASPDESISPPPTADTATPLPATGTTAAPQGFEINPLDAIGTDYAGTLDTGSGGFAVDMWRGTDRAKVERLLPLLKPTTSPVLADLTRRLLLSNAGAPAGKGSGASLMAPRAKLLADMGMASDAVALLKLQRPEERDPGAARLLAELSWRTGDLDGGCAAVTEALSRVKVESFWQQASIFCQYHAGHPDQASLGLDVLHEQGEEAPAFFALADALGGNSKVDVPPLAEATPLYLAMAHAAGLAPPKLSLRTPPPLMLALYAEDPDTDPADRVAAAETAAAAGVLSAKALAGAYTAKPADPAALESAGEKPDIGTTPETRALLYQAALHAADPEARAPLIRKALAAPVPDADYWARLQLYLPLLAEIQPSPQRLSFAPVAARHLYAGGRLQEADDWVAMLQQNVGQDQDAAASLSSLQALGYLAGGNAQPPVLDTLLSGPAQRPETIRAIFAAFAAPAPGDAQANLAPDATAMPGQNLNLWLDLGDAAAKSRIGETVLLSLAGLDAGGLVGVDPRWIERTIASLRQVGLERDARRLAVEAAIVNGL